MMGFRGRRKIGDNNKTHLDKAYPFIIDSMRRNLLLHESLGEPDFYAVLSHWRLVISWRKNSVTVSTS